MNFLHRLYQSIRVAIWGWPTPAGARPDFAAINNRADWPVNTTRGRWVAYRNEWTDR